MTLSNYFAYLAMGGLLVGAPSILWWFGLIIMDDLLDNKSNEATSMIGAVAVISWIIIGIGLAGAYLFD